MLGPLLLLLGTAAFYLAWLGAAGLYDPNGGRYAETPREMVLLLDWLTPPFNFIRHFEKPPLLYWLTSLAYLLLGISELSARLVTALASGLSYSCFGLLTIAVGLLPASWLFPRRENISLYDLFTAMDAYSRDIQYGILSNAEVYTVSSYEELVPLLQWATLILPVGIASATLAWLRRRSGLTLACLAGTMLPTLAFVQTGIVMFEPHRSIVRLADVILREFHPGDQIIIEGPYENFASANFYTDGPGELDHLEASGHSDCPGPPADGPGNDLGRWDFLFPLRPDPLCENLQGEARRANFSQHRE